MNEISRRLLLIGALKGALRGSEASIGLVIGNYGMKSLRWEQAVELIAGTGYDGVELCLISGWPTEPERLSRTDRKNLRALLRERRLALPSLLENLQINGSEERRAANLERLRRGLDLGYELAPGDRPVVLETVLGGATADWDRLKPLFVHELREWARVAEAAQATVCFKPHAGHAVHNPERALWLIREIGNRHLRLIYDFSHMQLEGVGLYASMKDLVPFAPFIHLKDAKGTSAHHQYLLPGDGHVDYVEYFRKLKQLAYSGYVGVEVSAMVFRQDSYDPGAAARLCYRRMSSAMRQAGVARPR